MPEAKPPMLAPEQPWPEDLAFQTLARKVADGVLWAVNTGQRITPSRLTDNCMCPLGATIIKDRRGGPSHPGAHAFLSAISRRISLADSDTVLPDAQMIWAFIAGFESGAESISSIDAVRASARLGLWYRKRFTGMRARRHQRNWTSIGLAR